MASSMIQFVYPLAPVASTWFDRPGTPPIPFVIPSVVVLSSSIVSVSSSASIAGGCIISSI